MRILRVLKGVAATAAMWGIVWVPLSFGLALLSTLLGADAPPREIWGWLAYRQAVVGVITGGVFATALALFGRKQTFASLGYGRMVLCGALGGAIFPIITAFVFARLGHPLPVGAAVYTLAINGTVAALCAAGSLRLARRAPELPSRAAQAELGPGAA